jgi:hypothetical protein
MEEALRRLNSTGPEAVVDIQGDDGEEPKEFDGMVWNAAPIPTDYVPTSIKPEYLAPVTGSDDEDEVEPLMEEEDEEEADGGR